MGIEVKKYFATNTDREIHMIGDYVGVCWNIEWVKEVKTNEDGNRVKVITSQRVGGPYIDFPWVDGDHERDDSTVDGGISVGQAEDVLEELRWACNYIRMME